LSAAARHAHEGFPLPVAQAFCWATEANFDSFVATIPAMQLVLDGEMH
jgi:hypothetical protein